MSTDGSAAFDNVVPLRARSSSPVVERAKSTAGEVRRQLGLLQGYADLMQGLSPEQSVRILKVMAEKVTELTSALRPFIEGGLSGERPPLGDYRQVQRRNMELMREYRMLLTRLRVSVNSAQTSLAAQSQQALSQD